METLGYIILLFVGWWIGLPYTAMAITLIGLGQPILGVLVFIAGILNN